METKIKITLKSGLIATAVMTLIILMAPMMGMPKMLIGNMLADFMHLPVFIGWVAHFMIGTVLAGMYVYVFKNILPGTDALKGMLYGMIPFLMAQIAMMPMMGMGFFTSGAGEMQMKMILGSMMGHIVYGLVLGLSAKQRTANISGGQMNAVSKGI